MEKLSLPELLLHLMLKSRQELESLTRSMTTPTPQALDVKIGNVSSSLNVTSDGRKMTLAFSESDKAYVLEMPLNISESPAQAEIRVTLSDKDQKQEHVVKGADLLTAPHIPDAFKGLHSKVIEYLKQFLPKTFFGTNQSAPRESTVPVVEPANAADTEDAPEFKTYTVHLLNEPDIRFEGKLLASVQSPIKQGRQQVFEVFETRSGKYVAIRLGRSWWLSEHNLVKLEVFTEKSGLVQFFGHSPMAKALYETLKVDNVRVID